MVDKKHAKWLLLLAIAGFLFSGYLSSGSLLSGACPINGECPDFLGYPACYYGFVMFTVLLVAAYLLYSGDKTYSQKTLLKALLAVSVLGMAFAGYFTLTEIINWTSGYALILPTCVYGFIFYAAIFWITCKNK